MQLLNHGLQLPLKSSVSNNMKITLPHTSATMA